MGNDFPADLPEMHSVDTRRGLQMLQGDQQRYLHWLWTFLAGSQLSVRQVRDALAAGDAEGAGMIVHALRGRAGLLGMLTVFELSSRLETAITDGEPSHQLLDAFEAAVLTVCSELRSTIGDAPEEIADTDKVDVVLPHEEAPGSVNRLIDCLKECDCESEALAAACLDELKGTAWEPALHQALRLCRQYEFPAALRMLTDLRS